MRPTQTYPQSSYIWSVNHRRIDEIHILSSIYVFFYHNIEIEDKNNKRLNRWFKLEDYDG